MRAARLSSFLVAFSLLAAGLPRAAQAAQPVRAKKGMVAPQSFIASQVGGIVWNKADKVLEGATDRRVLDGAAIGR